MISIVTSFPLALIQLPKLTNINLFYNKLTGSIPHELKLIYHLTVRNNCLTLSDEDQGNPDYAPQKINCSTISTLQQQAVGAYDDKTGVLIIEGVRIDKVVYRVELKDQGHYQFLLTNAFKIRRTVKNSAASYSFKTEIVDIPSVFAFGKLYTIQMKKNREGLFLLTKVIPQP